VEVEIAEMEDEATGKEEDETEWEDIGRKRKQN
jgi:hypothetical protein